MAVKKKKERKECFERDVISRSLKPEFVVWKGHSGTRGQALLSPRAGSGLPPLEPRVVIAGE